MNDELRLTLYWTTRALAVVSGVATVVTLLFAVLWQWEFWPYAALSGVQVVVLGIATRLIGQGQMSSGILVSLCSSLVLGGIMVLRFPELNVVLAVALILPSVIIGSICPPRVAYTLLVAAMILLSVIILEPPTLIPPVSLGPWVKVIATASALPVVFFGGLLARRLVERERQAQRALADALERLKAAQDQLLQNAQDRAVTDLATAAAHELAQPLTIILSEAGLLRDEPLSGNARASLNNLYTAAVRASRILGRIREARRYVTTSYLPGSTMVDLDRASE
ncbi:MAG TPA: histidine kinase dimerization/phospho-acceptor domain-containing protein [Roseiflexaceae bacterium]|nr:histidine kinase dimerization/phospho-acceptor domain-containing protein [Roseiflexaceae bacterium]